MNISLWMQWPRDSLLRWTVPTVELSITDELRHCPLPTKTPFASPRGLGGVLVSDSCVGAHWRQWMSGQGECSQACKWDLHLSVECEEPGRRCGSSLQGDIVSRRQESPVAEPGNMWAFLFVCFLEVEVFKLLFWKSWGFSVAARDKEPACQCRRHKETWVQSLGQEDSLEEEMATSYSILAWRIPWTEEPVRLQSMGSQRVKHNWVTNTFTFTKIN